MFRISNALIGLLNIVTTLLSIALIVWAIILGSHSQSECERFIQMPLLAFGVFLFVVSLIGIIGSCCKNSVLMWIYLLIMFLLILILLAFTFFAFIVTNKGVGKIVSNKGFKEYRLGNYSNWLQKRVVDERNWNKIKSCLHKAKVCSSIGSDVVIQKAAEFYRKNLTPIQSGCCNPPSYCGFTYQNATFWATPKSGVVSQEKDCKAWSNNQDGLCYNCDSCKAGVLANLKHDWRKLAIINASMLVFIVIVYSVGCCAFRNNRYDNRHKRYVRA